MKRIMRRGIAISPTMNKVRLFLLLTITPFVTWYAHQNFTNPYQFYPTVEIRRKGDIPVVHLYEENSFTAKNHVYIPLSTETLTVDSARVLTLEKNQIALSDGASIWAGKRKELNSFFAIAAGNMILLTNSTGFFDKTVIDCGREETLSPHLPQCDIFITTDTLLERIYKKREQLTPRLTVLIHSFTEKLPTNVYSWKGSTISFKESEYYHISVVE